MKPILFSTPMIQAILEGRKTMTRRIKGFDGPVVRNPNDYVPAGAVYDGAFDENDPNSYCDFKSLDEEWMSLCKCPYGKVGGILWVRESFQWDWQDYPENTKRYYFFKADWKGGLASGEKWKPSIFMPKDACRIFLEITDIKVERLNEISEEDCINEGIKYVVTNMIRGYKDYMPLGKNIIESIVDSPKESFQSLWQSINGEKSWENNIWVWAISFKRIDKPTTRTPITQ